MRKALKVIISSFLLLLIIVFIDKFSFCIAELVYPLIRDFDSDNVFMLLTIHHIIQMAIALLVILVIVKLDNTTLSNRGFNADNFSYSLKAVIIFSFIWILIQFGVGYYMVNYLDYVPGLSYPLTAKNIISKFLFQLLLTGTSEEILFRVLPLSLLLFVTEGKIDNSKFKILFIIIATIIFMLDHIGFAITPIKIVHFNVLQQLTALVFGGFYGWLLVKTKSIVGPMIAHGVLNTIIVSSELIFYLAYK